MFLTSRFSHLRVHRDSAEMNWISRHRNFQVKTVISQFFFCRKKINFVLSQWLWDWNFWQHRPLQKVQIILRYWGTIFTQISTKHIPRLCNWNMKRTFMRPLLVNVIYEKINILLIKILKNTSVTRPLELDYKLLHKDRYFFYKRLH